MVAYVANLISGEFVFQVLNGLMLWGGDWSVAGDGWPFFINNHLFH